MLLALIPIHFRGLGLRVWPIVIGYVSAQADASRCGPTQVACFVNHCQVKMIYQSRFD